MMARVIMAGSGKTLDGRNAGQCVYHSSGQFENALRDEQLPLGSRFQL